MIKVSTTFPGTTIETTSLEKGSSKNLFDGIFAAGGITLSQVSIMTGLEPYMIQNWVKRGFVTSPVKRVYSKEQFARIVIINMLKDSLQIEKICSLIKIIGGDPNDRSDDLINDDVLYHKYVDMISGNDINISDAKSVVAAAKNAVADMKVRSSTEKKTLMSILQVMLYAHAASKIRALADEILISLDH